METAAAEEAVERELTPEEMAALGVEPEESAAPEAEAPDFDDIKADSAEKEGFPEWAIVPPDIKLPPGRQLIFVQFKSGLTDRPAKGDRQCVMWNLTEADEKLALKRCRGDNFRTIDELTKQAIRVVDGVRTDWSSQTSKGSIHAFWNEVGGKCRAQLKNFYVKSHSLTTEESVDFFTNCVAVRTANT